MSRFMHGDSVQVTADTRQKAAQRPAPAERNLYAAGRHCAGSVRRQRFDLRGRRGMWAPLDRY